MFCPKCNSLLVPKRTKYSKYFVCKKCGKKFLKEKGRILEVSGEKKNRIIFIDHKREDDLPKTKVLCPKCGHDTAYYWLVQTRASDEPPTKFLKCVKCEHRWRDYS